MHHDVDFSDYFSSPDSNRERAFEAIYDRFEAPLYRYVYSKVKVKEVSEEIIQEIFINLWIKRDSLRIDTSLEGWLFGAAKHKILTHIKSQNVRERYAANFALFVAGRFDNSSEELLELKDVQKAIEESISELPKKCQIAFRLSRMQHEPTQRIAEHMNISKRTVENYISIALKHLRVSLEKMTIIFILIKISFLLV